MGRSCQRTVYRHQSIKTAADKRRSTIDDVTLTRFPIGFSARLTLVVSCVFGLIFVGLAIAELLSLVSALTGFVVGSAASSAVVFHLLKPLRNLVARSEKIVIDPLARYVYSGRNNKIGQLEYVQIFQHAKLLTAIGRVKESSSVLEQAAADVAKGNAHLSQRTENQASSLEETASSLEEITFTVQQNASNATRANQLVNDARQQAEKSGSVF